MAAIFITSDRLSNEPNLTAEDMRREAMRKIKHGQVISSKDFPHKSYVTAFYPDFVLCHGSGVATTYTYYQLWKMLQRKADKINLPEKLKRR